jgi:hypothetical protein
LAEKRQKQGLPSDITQPRLSPLFGDTRMGEQYAGGGCTQQNVDLWQLKFA